MVLLLHFQKREVFMETPGLKWQKKQDCLSVKAYFAKNRPTRNLRSKNSTWSKKGSDLEPALKKRQRQFYVCLWFQALKKVEFLGYNREGSGKSFWESELNTFNQTLKKESLFRFLPICKYTQIVHLGSKVLSIP